MLGDMPERMSEDMSERMSKDILYQKECQKIASNESVKLSVTRRIQVVYCHV